MQNPRNTMNSRPGSAAPATVKGRPAVASGSGSVTASKAILPSFPQATAGARKVVSATSSGPAKGVTLGTFHGKHHVAHPISSGGPTTTSTLMQGQ